MRAGAAVVAVAALGGGVAVAAGVMRDDEVGVAVPAGGQLQTPPAAPPVVVSGSLLDPAVLGESWSEDPGATEGGFPRTIPPGGYCALPQLIGRVEELYRAFVGPEGGAASQLVRLEGQSTAERQQLVDGLREGRPAYECPWSAASTVLTNRETPAAGERSRSPGTIRGGTFGAGRCRASRSSWPGGATP